MELTAQKKREDWMDIARGLAIIFVMVGHAKLFVPAAVVYVFHMPLFFFISGYFFSGGHLPGKQFAAKKAKRLLVPYYILSIPMLITFLIQDLYKTRWHFKFINRSTWVEYIVKQIFQIRYSTLWYIACLFWMSLIFFLILKLTKQNLKAMFIISLIMIVVVVIYNQFTGWFVPGNIDLALSMMIFYVAGYAAKQKQFFERPKVKNTPIRWFIIFIIIALVIGAINLAITGKKVDIYWNDYGVYPLMYLGAFAGIFAILCLSRKINSKFLKYIGKNSILFYAWHQAITFPLAEFLMVKLHLFCGPALGQKVAQTIICIAFSIAVLWIPTHLLKDTKAGKWFGF